MASLSENIGCKLVLLKCCTNENIYIFVCLAVISFPQLESELHQDPGVSGNVNLCIHTYVCINRYMHSQYTKCFTKMSHIRSII